MYSQLATAYLANPSLLASCYKIDLPYCERLSSSDQNSSLHGLALALALALAIVSSPNPSHNPSLLLE